MRNRHFVLLLGYHQLPIQRVKSHCTPSHLSCSNVIAACASYRQVSASSTTSTTCMRRAIFSNPHSPRCQTSLSR